MWIRLLCQRLLAFNPHPLLKIGSSDCHYPLKAVGATVLACALAAAQACDNVDQEVELSSSGG